MFKNSKVVTLICGTISIAITVLLYLLTFNNIFTIPMRWVSLMFLILAECIATAKALGVKKSIFGVTNLITSAIHLTSVLVISIVFINIFPLLITKYILVNVLLLCALLVIDVIIVHFGGHVSDKNNELAQNQSIMDALYNKVKEISLQHSNSEHKEELEKIADMIKYSDSSTLSNDEANILNMINELQKMMDNGEEKISEKMQDIKNAIEMRSLKIKNTKRGNY